MQIILLNINEVECKKWIFHFFHVKVYLGINSMKLETNGIDHILTADKYTPR